MKWSTGNIEILAPAAPPAPPCPSTSTTWYPATTLVGSGTQPVDLTETIGPAATTDTDDDRAVSLFCNPFITVCDDSWWVINIDWSYWGSFVADIYATSRASVNTTPPPSDTVKQFLDVNLLFGPIAFTWSIDYSANSVDFLGGINCDTWNSHFHSDMDEWTADSFTGTDTDCVASPGLPGADYPGYTPLDQYWVHETAVPSVTFPGGVDVTFESNYAATHTKSRSPGPATFQPLSIGFTFWDSSVGNRGSTAPLTFLTSMMIPSAGVFSGSDYTSLPVL